MRPRDALVRCDAKDMLRVQEAPFRACVRRWKPWATNQQGYRLTKDHLTGGPFFDMGDHYTNQHGRRVRAPEYDADATIERTVHQRLLQCTATFLPPPAGAPPAAKARK